MRIKYSVTLVAFLWSVMLTLSCSDDSEETTVDCSATAVTFAEANAVIQSSCAKNSSCHGSGSNKGPGALTTYAQIYNARNEINDAVRNGSMPQDSRLSTTEKNTILCWIENGAGN